MHGRFWHRGGWVELGSVRLYSHNDTGVRGEQNMWHHRQHGVGEVLHHQGHPVRLRPAEREQGASLRLAGLERDACPSQRAPELHQPPIMGTLIHEERFARGYRMDIDGVSAEVVWEGLLDIEDHLPNGGVLLHQAIKGFRHIGRIRHHAVEVACQPRHALLTREVAYRYEPLVIPREIILPQFHLQTRQTIAGYPVVQRRGSRHPARLARVRLR